MTPVPSHDLLTDAGLAAVLGRHPFVTQIIYRARLESTNDTAKQLADQGAPEGLLVITDEQTAGRGRFGRRWWAPVGSALLTSLLFRPAAPCERPAATGEGGVHIVQQLMMLCALSAADAIIHLTALPVELKWPNDLLVRGRKLAGLLAESVFQGDRLESVVVGMGMNVNMTFADAPPFIATATSLQLELGHPVHRQSLLVAYVNGVAQRYAQLRNGSNPYEEWSNRCEGSGQQPLQTSI